MNRIAWLKAGVALERLLLTCEDPTEEAAVIELIAALWVFHPTPTIDTHADAPGR